MKTSLTLPDRIRGCFVGVALGDALGMPWELRSRDEILALTQGQGVTGLQDFPPEHPRLVADTRGLALGETTDDWQLTRAVATSLIRCGGFHLVDQAAAHVEAYESSIKGWGGSTRDAMAAIKRWFDSRGREGRRPDLPAPPVPKRGKGNGVLMKLSPLACHVALRRQQSPGAIDDAELRRSITTLGRMSHQEDVSADVGAVLLALLEDRWSPLSPAPVLALLEDPALVTTLTPLFRQAPSADEARTACGTSFLASESAAFGLATLLRHPDDFASAVLEAINGGGDTDTNAAIVGALVGARVGVSGIPADWIAAVPGAQEALALADTFVATFA